MLNWMKSTGETSDEMQDTTFGFSLLPIQKGSSTEEGGRDDGGMEREK